MDGRIDVITLLFLIVAVVVILKLRSVLGRRTGDEEARYERQARAQQEARERAAAAKDKVVSMPRRERETAAAPRREQEEALIPLSKARAEAVKQALVKLGLDEARVATAGVGGAQPLVAFGDSVNRWKNRRVEFILIKKS